MIQVEDFLTLLGIHFICYRYTLLINETKKDFSNKQLVILVLVLGSNTEWYVRRQMSNVVKD